MNNRIIGAQSINEEEKNEYTLRPRWLSEYIGQDKTKDKLDVFIQAAKNRGESLDHVLLSTLR